MTNPSHEHLDEQKETKKPRNVFVWSITIMLAFAAAVWLAIWLKG